MNSNLTTINGYLWDSNLNIWLNDEKINSSYDLNNNRLCDTSFGWSILNLAWEYSSLQTYSFDISNQLQSNANYIWNSAWEELDKNEYTYDVNGNKTSETYSFWDFTNLIWEPNSKSQYHNFINSNPTETANFYWDLANSVWVAQDKNKQTHNLNISYPDLIVPFYYEQDLFHHQLNTVQGYAWNEIDLNWAINNSNTYYYTDITIGIETQNINSLSVLYPNPTTDVANFKLPKEETNYTINIFNIAGAKILSLDNVNMINVSDFNSGLYIYSITSKNNIYKGKFVKQ